MSTTTGMPPTASKEALARAGRWFLRSGIQDSSGGVARYHLIVERWNAAVSTEITGYAVSALLELFGRTGDPAYLDAARRGGDFLCLAWDEEAQAMPFEWSARGETPARLSYFFDNGIVTRALLRLSRAADDGKYLAAAVRCGESMRRDFLNSNDIHPVLALPDKTPIERDGRWSRTSACYQLKAAMAWLELAEATGDQSFAQCFDRALDRGLATQARFLSQALDEHGVMDRLHAYNYFLAALIGRSESPEATLALEEGIARAAAHLRRVRAEFERSDVNAQLLRVRLWADALGVVKLNRKEAEEEAAWAARYQIASSDERLDGAYNFGQRSGTLTNYANPVSTAFCMQALAMWEEYMRGGIETDWHQLI